MINLKQIALIQQTQPIKAVAWNPLVKERLAFCCASGLLYLWEYGLGCDAIEVPAGNYVLTIVSFNIVDLAWNPDGKSLLLMDKDKFCLTFLVDE